MVMLQGAAIQANVEKGSVYIPLSMMVPALGPGLRRLANVLPDARHKELIKVGGWVVVAWVWVWVWVSE